METLSTGSPAPERHSKRRKRWLLLVPALLFLAAAASAGYLLYWPNGEHRTPDTKGLAKPVYYQGQPLGMTAIGEDEGIKLPFAVFKDFLDPTIRYEEQSQSVIITTKDKVVRLKTSQLTGIVNNKPFTLDVPVEQSEGAIYLPVEPLRKFYSFDIAVDRSTGAVLLRKAGDTIQWGKAAGSTKHPDGTKAMRSEPDIKAPIYLDLKRDEPVMIWGESGGWYRIQAANGYIGYSRKSDIVLDRIETVPAGEAKSAFVPWKPLGGKINLTWQQVVNKNPDMSKLPQMPGLNVISPQWFHLADGEGRIQNLADPVFAKWARDNNLQLWALFSNGFDPKRTTDALATYDRRFRMIQQLLAFAQMYSLQGINIDFENVSIKDKDNMVQFVREMVPFLHEQGLVVSIDVTVKDGSDNYSRFMDRKAVGDVVDYMMLMAYDEYWASSPKAGSVSSLPWTERGLAQILEEDRVPPSKMVLGIPFYTRIWTEQTKEGSTSVTSKTLSMDGLHKLLDEKKLTPVLDSSTGQNYVEYSEDGKTMRIWMEDRLSMQARLDLVKKYDLAGIASWSRGFETTDIWPFIRDSLEKRP